MSKYAIRRGHQRTGQDGCASDYLNEIDVANGYYKYIIKGLKAQGHQVLDVTPPEANRSLGNSLSYGIHKANNWGADYFISCHANSCASTARAVGCEVLYYHNSSKGLSLAKNVCSKISKLGFINRGAKSDVRGLAELRKTYCPSIIIEPLFVSSLMDTDLYNKIGGEALGNAIVEGLTGKSVVKYGWINSAKGWWYCTNPETEDYYKNEWKYINGQWFSFGEWGYAKCNTWELYKGKWYYLTSDCSMAVNKWLWIDGECYCFGSDGAMYLNTKTPDGYNVDEHGCWIN